MKRNNAIIAILVATIFGTAVAVTNSLAWITTKASMERSHNPIEGIVEDEYYASGTGTAQDPFIITKPRHLYNLAWLQLLGFYNKNAGVDNHQFYFELGDNVDMSEYCAIPPIGTELNPFVGSFDGKGYVISGVKISNDFTDYTLHPSVINAWDNSTRKQPHIMGLFGIVGEYPNCNKPTVCDTTVNQFINTGVTGANIKTVVADSLVGVAAGYVKDANLTDAHKMLKNIVIDNSNIELPASGTNTSYGGHTSNISDFTLVGYTNDSSGAVKASKSLYGINVDTNMSFNATESGAEEGWGGSIDMMSVTKRLQTIRDTVNVSSFEYHSRYTHNEGSANPTHTAVGTDNRYTKLINNNDNIGHFNFITGTDTVNERYALMGGGHWQEDIYNEYVVRNAFKITNGAQYLKVTSTTIDKTATASEGSYWAQDNNGRLFTKSGNNYYYLRNNNGTLQATTTANNGSSWTIDDSGANRLIYSAAGNGTRYAISYSNNAFALITGTATGNVINPYSIRYQTNNAYMSYSGTELVNSTSQTKIWYFTSTTNNTQIYTIINGENYYLNPNNISNNEYMNLSKTNQTGWTWGTSGTYKTLTVQNAGNNAYRRLSYYPSDDEWYLSKNANYNKLTITGTDEYVFTSNISKTASDGSISGPDLETKNTVSKMNYEADDVTYFPLSTINNTNNFNPADNNTAYVVGGSRLAANTTTYDDNLTNVRFGYYPISGNISNDYNSDTGTFSNVYTVENNSRVRITDDSQYEKLTDAKSSLGAVMKGQTNVYGLHFMQSEISMDALTTAKVVRVNGVTHTNYELPVNSIDFHLKEFGYINFLSGSYYPGNTSFFSLYQIERNDSNNPGKITGIFEVKNVYQHKDKVKNYSYVYELTDGTNTFYTKPYKVLSSEGDKEWLYDSVNPWSKNQYINSLPADYRLAFNVANIKGNTIASNTFEKHVYYFEIPMNDGEFCLGSVSGADGSYLMYLDIGANAAKTNRTIAYEKFSLTEKTYHYPVGVVLQTLPTTYTSGVATININTTVDQVDSACMVIQTNANGSYAIDRNNAEVTLTRTNASLAPPIYAGDAITSIHEKNSAQNIEPTPVSSVSYDVRRMQYFDYMVNTDTLSVTTFTDYSSDGGNTYTRVIEQSRYTGTSNTGTPVSTYIYDPRGDTPVDQRSSMKIYNTSTGVKYTDAEIINTTNLPISANKLSSTVILEFSFFQEGGDSYDELNQLVMVVDTSVSQTESYYKYGNYTIVFTPTSGTITIKVLDYSSAFTVTVYNVGTGATSSDSATTAITVNGTTITGEGQTVVIGTNP